MGEIFTYSIVSGVILLALYIVYKWILAGEKQFGFNRITICAIYLTALFLPLGVPSLCSMWEQLISPAGIATPSAVVTAELPQVAIVDNDSSLIFRLLLWFYLGGLIVTTGYTVVTAVRLYRLIKGGDSRPYGRYRLVLSKRDDVAPFSWMRFMVMNRDDFETSGEVIVIHETRHLELAHWVDLLLAQCVAIFMWYNPAAWLLREELKAIHEYQADEAVVRSGAGMKEYQMLLVKKAVGARFPSLANSLNHSKLKKRITMMYKTKSNVVRRMWALSLLPAAAVAVAVAGTPFVNTMLSAASSATLTAQSNGKSTEKITSPQTITLDGHESNVLYYIDGKRMTSGSDLNAVDPSQVAAITVKKGHDNAPDTIYLDTRKGADPSAKGGNVKGGDKIQITGYGTAKKGSAQPASQVMKEVEVQPEFPGGIQALMTWLGENIRYPEEAMKAGTEGRVVVRFVVSATGVVTSPEIIRSISPALDAEALRVVGEMPVWTPGKNDGKPVACQYVLPIHFSTKGK